MTDVRISIMIDNVHIQGSPFKIKSWNSDSCKCPQTMAQFKKAYHCPTEVDSGFKESLARFNKTGFQEYMILEGAERLRDINNAYIQYVIKDNKIYTKNHTEISGFKQFFDRAFTSLSNKVILPDAEFLLNLGDWPLVHLKNPKHKDSHGRFFPMFSGCLDGKSADMIMPTWVDTRYIFNEAIENVAEIDSKSYGQGPWATKEPKVFWRGRDANAERIKLAEMAKTRPDLLDVGLTHYFFFRNGEEQRFGRAKYVNFVEFWKYKYMLNIDGTVAAYRLMTVLAGNSVVLKQDSPYVEWFYHHLKPYEHYIPVKRDLSDLVEQVEWAREHDEEVQKIARNARVMMRELKSPERIYCQFFQFFEEVSKMMRYPVEVRPDMEFVPGPSPLHGHTCQCHYKTANVAAKKAPSAQVFSSSPPGGSPPKIEL